MSSSTSTVPDWVSARILSFFNQAWQVSDILDGTIQDDPRDGAGRTLGPAVAARILRTRRELPRGRFTDFSQIDAVPGVGEGTIKDLMYSFGRPAAEVFQNSMYDNNIIYRENWKLDFFRTVIEDGEAFDAIVRDEKQFRQWVAEKIEAISEERGVKKAHCTDMVKSVKTAYIDVYNNSIMAPGFAFALWFYEFDADNWFSWEVIQSQTLGYFDYHMDSNDWEMELRFFKGFQQQGIIPSGIEPPDLPVVVNWPEKAITLWFSALYD